MKHTTDINKLLHILSTQPAGDAVALTLRMVWVNRTLASILRFIHIALMSSFALRIRQLDPVSYYAVPLKKPAELCVVPAVPTFTDLLRVIQRLPVELKLACISYTYVLLVGAICTHLLRSNYAD